MRICRQKLLRCNWRIAACAWRLRGFACLLAAVSCAAAHAENSYEAHQVKAVFVFHFANFVEWPPQAFDGPADAFRFCVLGDDPVGDNLKKLVSGETVRGRRVEFLSTVNHGRLDSCHIVFVPSARKQGAAAANVALQGRSILTVGDGKDFLRHGGMIGLVSERNRVRPQINVDALARSGLLASAKLLQLATVIHEHPQQARK